MSVVKYYAGECDYCETGIDYHHGCSKKRAIELLREIGAIVTRDGKCFCSDNCYDGFKENNNQTERKSRQTINKD